MKLHLLRHAKSEPYSDSGKDIDRDLLPKGIQQCIKMSDYLNDLSNFDIYSSSSKRTRKTFELVFLKINYNSIHFDEKLYLAELDEYLDFISNLNTNKDILIIGHNNGLSNLYNFLCNSDKDLKTCEYAELVLNISKWSEISSSKAEVIRNFYPKII